MQCSNYAGWPFFCEGTIISKKPIKQDPLRTTAEAKLAHAPAKKPAARPAEELLHELEVHQIELEMQNDELRKAQAIIEKMRDRYVDLYECAPVGYLTLNRAGIIAEANLTGAALLGVERNKLLKHRFSRFVIPENQDQWEQHFLAVLQRDGRQSCELSLLRPDGSRFHAQITSLKTGDFLSSHVLDDPKLNKNIASTAPLLRLVITDLSALKRTEKTLASANEKFHLLFDSISDAIFITGMDGRFILVNQSACERLGYSHEELLQIGPADIDSPEYAPKVPERIRILQQQGQLVCESAQVRKDGTVIPIELNSRIIDYDGQPTILTVARDLTERKKTEVRLRDLTAYIQAVREEEKTNLAREIHDDLGSALLSLKMKTQRLKTLLTGSDEESKPLLSHVQEMSQTIDHTAEVMRNIITGLRPPVLDMLGLLAALKWQAVLFHNSTGIRCRVNSIGDKDNLDTIQSMALFRISQEALSNVARHSGATAVEIEYFHSNEEVCMSIIDNGRGMPDTLTDNSKHFGMLGMRERIEQFGGSINCETPPGGGFCVTVILPLSAEERINK